MSEISADGISPENGISPEKREQAISLIRLYCNRPFRDHGKLRNSLTEDVAGAAKVMQDLERAGISMKEVTDKLTQDGVKLFAEAFDKLLAAVQKNTQSKG